MGESRSDANRTIRFAVLPLPVGTGRTTEFARTMAPHPLVHQELPYEPHYTIYNRRLTAMRMGNATPDEAYWRLRRQVILRHTGELPIEVRGPDAVRLLNRVFTRDVAKTQGRPVQLSARLLCRWWDDHRRGARPAGGGSVLVRAGGR